MIDTVKKSRIVYIDIMRGLAILFMFIQHAVILHEYTGGEGENIIANLALLVGTAPAAPVFLFIMGVFIAASRSERKKMYIRGSILFIAGYILNFFRFSLPLFIATFFGYEYALGENPLTLFFTVDILQLAGLAMIITAFLKPYLSKTTVILLIIVSISVISPMLWKSFGTVSMTAPLWGIGDSVFFPLFPWLIYPLMGALLSPYMIDGMKDKKIRNSFLISSLVLIVMGIVFYDLFPVGDYFRSGASIHMLMTAFILFWCVCIYRIMESLSEDGLVTSLLVDWSKNVTALYCIQWILFGWSIFIFGEQSMSVYGALTIGFIVLVISHIMIQYTGVKKLFSYL